MSNDEKKLIQNFRDGEAKHMGQLIAHYGPSLMAFVGRIVTRQEDAEDVVQESFVNAYEHLKDFNPEKASLKTWLHRLAYHEALRHLRRQRREVHLPFEVSDDTPEDLPDTTTAEQLDMAILQLSPEDQMLLQLYYFDQRSLKEIAYITGNGRSSESRQARLDGRDSRAKLAYPSPFVTDEGEANGRNSTPPERESSRLSSQLYRIRQQLRIILKRMNDE